MDNPAAARSPTTCWRANLTDALGDGRSAVVVAPGGVTDCWERAARGGMAPVLVIAATERALDRRAEALAERHDLIAAAVHGDLRADALTAVREQLAAGHYDVALVPGRHLGAPRVRAALEAMPARLVVVERAHRLATHGWEFDPSWLRIATLIEALGPPPVLATTEVASAAACDEIARRLGIVDALQIVSDLAPGNLRLEVRNLAAMRDRDRNLLALMQDAPERAVIFVADLVEAERIAEMVEERCGIATGVFAPGDGAVLRGFRQGSVRALVTVTSLEPGADVPPVPLVVHYDIPPGLEQYVRQALVAGRDGAPATSVLLYDRATLPAMERRALGRLPAPGQLLAIYRAIADADGSALPYATLSRLTGLHPLDVHLSVEMLCLGGAVETAARGDEWIAARAVAQPNDAIHEASMELDGLMRARQEHMEQIVAWIRSSMCRRRSLLQRLGHDGPEEAEGSCCDRCAPEEVGPLPDAPAPGYPLHVGDLRGWAVDLYRRPGDVQPASKAGELVHALKYQRADGAAQRLAWMMAKRVRMTPILRSCDLMVPVPPRDQADVRSPAALLCEPLALLCKREMVHALVSVGERLPQESLTSWSEKKRNISGAFKLAAGVDLADRTVLLVDDIFDSGATMLEAARVLRSAGAKDVCMLAAVRTTSRWRRET